MTLTVDFDSLPRTYYMPAGGSVSVRFIDKSVSTNGIVNSWAWTFGDGGTAAIQNPVHLYSATGIYAVSLTCNDTGGTGATTITKTAWIKIESGTFIPPAQTTAFRNLTLFVYERSNESSPKSACICRNKTSACNLLFMNLSVNGAITKAGKATFDIVNTGGATANEIDLFESTTIGRYKNIAIIGGYDVIWSGKITKAEKELMSQPGTSSQKAIYHCEAYSDIRKLSDWNIIASSQSTQTLTPGRITAAILALNSGEPDFIGTRGGFIDYSGAKISQTLSNIDKLSAFSALASATDYDWRTRMETMLFQYATFNGSNQVTITSAGLTPGNLVGNWLLFPTENYLNSGVSTPNYTGILAWGIITANTATTITATLAGASSVPTATDNCLIVQVPRLDFSSDLTEPSVVRAFTNNTNAIKFANADNKDDFFTKVIAKGTASFITPVYSKTISATTATISASLAAKDAMSSSTGFFQNSTYITYKTQGYVNSVDLTNKYVYLFGQDYALATSDTVHFNWKPTPLGTYGWSSTISAISLVTAADGSPCTRLTLASVTDTPKYAVAWGPRLYVADNSISTASSPYDTLKCGISTIYTEAGGIDATYGPYITMYSLLPDDLAGPHYPGCLVSKITHSETSPQTGSAVQINGIIPKTITPGSISSMADLEVAATAALLQGSTYYQKSTLTASYYQWCANRVRDGVQITKPALIREGQRISVVPYTGASAVERQVVEWTLDTMTMVLSVTLGDYVKDVWNYLDRNTAATQKALI